LHLGGVRARIFPEDFEKNEMNEKYQVLGLPAFPAAQPHILDAFSNIGRRERINQVKGHSKLIVAKKHNSGQIVTENIVPFLLKKDLDGCMTRILDPNDINITWCPFSPFKWL